MLMPLRGVPELSPGEIRWTFLGERPDAFCEVVAIAELELRAPLKIELRCEVVVERFHKDLARADESEAGASRESGRYLTGVLPEGAVIDGLPDEPPFGGVLGSEPISQQREPPGTGGSDQLG